MKRGKIVIEDYNTSWPITFEKIKAVLINHLNSDQLIIEHVGSTSVVGLAAKPIIDIDIIIKDDDNLKREVINGLSELGYLHIGNLGITGREAFRRKDSRTPVDGSDTVWDKHNLYLCKKDSIGVLNHLNFRNHLRANPAKVVAYGKLKRQLAETFPYDIDKYIDGKTDFITNILKLTGMAEGDIGVIDGENKLG